MRHPLHRYWSTATIGGPENCAPLARILAKNLGVCVACPQYRLAPEYKFSTGVSDVWDGLKWITVHTNTVGADPAQGFIIGGVSAGGNFASVLAHLARDGGLTPPLTGMMLSAHQCLPPSVVPETYKGRYLSRSDPACMDAPVLNRKSKKMFEEALGADEGDQMFGVFNWKNGHEGLPQTYIQVCGMDVNRDEAIIYEDVLTWLGVKTKMDVYPGMPHIFWSVFTTHSLTKKWWSDTLAGVAWLLGKDTQL